ncbi:flavin-containing monooxygenase [Microlunatus parietis]|uniref:Cation diffusion facilitator CzcD-associated flavoprotein CzcO n=1 Tax=Microlunatus parietis TaxID=682979 RepID=A0A7Y9IF66_9ACTN|nr:NAD(P)/FAD-dependent oxidoreductase [Microlunatus parietis]NYE75592.1 cation diffusion facilitator CzcD-associated flavoprotein CzcO [Microlunatus parietis]
MERFDVIIVGAGISGIGAACQLRRRRPGRTFAVLESRDRIGGTWDLFRYPGVRSDSDMFTLGYAFRPWRGPRAIADGASIRNYVEDTARAFGVDREIRFGHRVRAADWDDTAAQWTVTVEHGGELRTLSCRWLALCAGYYDFEAGHRPDFPGEQEFRGRIVHPQQWPADLDHDGKRVIVIGSGATAMTLVPALARTAAKVIMVQRTPSYVVSQPRDDPFAERLPGWLPSRLRPWLVRWRNLLLTQASYELSRRRPEEMKARLRRGLRHALPEPYDLDTHFTPPYQPWDQRLCVVPDGDLFHAINEGRVEVVTGRIDTFTPTGLRLRSGRELDAELIITATGLTVRIAGGIRLSVDGVPVDPGRTVTYRGVMLCGVPNLSLVIGYVNASWTLRADLVSGYLVRLLRLMDRRGFDRVVPEPPKGDLGDRPLLDLRSGYIARAAAALPKQGKRSPWLIHQNYLRELWPLRFRPLRFRPLRDGILQFRRRAAPDHGRSPVDHDRAANGSRTNSPTGARGSP